MAFDGIGRILGIVFGSVDVDQGREQIGPAGLRRGAPRVWSRHRRMGFVVHGPHIHQDMAQMSTMSDDAIYFFPLPPGALK